MPNHLAIATQMIAHYNAQDADAYVSLMSDSACEASYRGAVVREGKEGTRSFVPTPSTLSFSKGCTFLRAARAISRTRAVLRQAQHGRVLGEGGLCSRVEFIR